jgi:hypothetical protein
MNSATIRGARHINCPQCDHGEVTLCIASHPLRFVFSLPFWKWLNTWSLSMFHLKGLIRTAGAVCLAILLSGCVIEPAWGPYYGHPHHWGY